MEEQLENLDSQKQEEFIVPETDEPTEVGLPADPIEVDPVDDVEEDVEILRQKNQELYEQLRKAKGFKRDPQTGKWVKPEPKTEVKIAQTAKDDKDITIMELKSLLAANIHDDSDSEEVRLYARSHGITITEALKLEEVKSLVRTRMEIRKTAEASSINSRRGGSSQKTGETLLGKIRNGEKITSDDDFGAIARARIEEKKAKFRNN